MNLTVTVRRMAVVFGLAAGLAVCGRLEAAQVDAVWFGGVGNWNNTGNWLGGVVPNNGANTYNVKIDNGNAAVSSVTLDMAPAIDNLTIDAGEMLSINNGQQFFLATGAGAGTVNNAGTLQLNSTGGHTYIRPIAGGTVTLTGGGTLKLSNQTTNWMYGNTTGATLLNANNTIEGAGNLGWAGVPTAIINQGTILANVSNPLVIDTTSAGTTNSGTMRASNGGTLSISATSVNNVGGLIEALNGSTVELANSATVVGGTLSTTGTGVVSAFSSSILDGQANAVTSNGLVRINNAHRLALKGSIVNTGTITLNSTGNFTYIHPNAAVTLTGGGVVQLTDVSDVNYIYPQGTGSLINVNNKFQGAGNIGWAGAPMSINNQGTIIANATNWLRVDGSGGMTNTGTMRATSGGTLKLDSGNFTNVGGVIEAQNGSTVELSGSATILGGTLSTTGTGVFSVFGGGGVVLDGTSNTVNSGATVRVNNGQRMTLRGTINNSGTIVLNSSGSETDIFTNGGPVNLTGGGVVQLSDTNNVNYIYTQGGGSLVNVNNTMRGAGNIGWPGVPMAINNQGTIIADVANALNVDASGGFTNSGSMQATGAGGLQILSGTFTTSGNVTVAAGSLLSRAGSYPQTAGSTTVNGTMSASGGVDIQGGVLKGSGTISSPVTNAGLVQPGNSAGVLTISNTYTQSAGGTLSIEIGGTTLGTQYDRLAVSGTATLAGTLSVTLINGYTGNIGDSFVVLTGGSVSGSFSTLNLPCLQAQGKQFQVVINPTNVTLSIVPAPSPLGDMNCDCVRDASDVAEFILALTDPNAFMAAHPTCPILRGDFDGNLVVNGKDIAGFVDAYLP